MKRMPLLASFALFVLLCASIAFWAMQLFKPSGRSMAPPTQVGKPEVHLDAVAALFGGRPAQVAVASNFQLKGVVMSGTPGESVAILSADGKPAQTARVNKEIVPGVVVKEVHPNYVMLSEGGTSKRVDLPESAKNSMSMGGPAPVPGMMPGPVAEPQPLNAPSPMPGIPDPPHGANPMAPNPMAPAMPNSPPVMGGVPQQGQPGGEPPQGGVPNSGVIQVPAPR